MRDPDRTHQTCTKCGETKPVAGFDKVRDGKSGPILHTRCRTCRSAAAYRWFLDNHERALRSQRRRSLRVRYGITPEQYDDLLARQDGGCAICCARTAGAGFTSLAVDHDHASGAVRGLLCNRCNRALGMLGEDVDRSPAEGDQVSRRK